MKAAAKSGAVIGVRGMRAAVLVAALVAFSGAQAQTVAIAPAKEKSWAQRMFGRQDWSEVQRAYESPRAVCRLVGENVRYASEKTDNWSPASATWGKGKGDCEDIAVCVQELCRQSGFSSKVHLYFPATGGREGHAVLVGEWNGKTWFSSNGEYEEVKSEQEVRQRVAKMLSCKESKLWVMKLSETDVAKYLEKTPARAVASATAN